MSREQEAVELLMAARGRMRDASELILRVCGIPTLSQIGYGKDSFDEVTQEELDARTSEIVDQVSGWTDILRDESIPIEERRARVRSKFLNLPELEPLKKQWAFDKSSSIKKRVEDFGRAIANEGMKVHHDIQGARYWHWHEEYRSIEFSEAEVFERPDGMTDEQVRNLARCLDEAGEKVGEAAELVTSEMLEEIRRALESFRDEVLGTVE